MDKELELEAENEFPMEGGDSFYGDLGIVQQLAFIAGATSKWVEKQKLEFAIEFLNKVLDDEEINKIAFDRVFLLRQELELKLKELENE